MGRKTTEPGARGDGAARGAPSWAEDVDPRTLVPWVRNPKRIAEAAVVKLAKAIGAVGWGAPILARRADRRIIAGHRRQRAALVLLERGELPGETVPVRWVEVDDERAAAMALADQRHAEDSEWDDVALADLLGELNDEYVDTLGWVEKERQVLEALLGPTVEVPEPSFVHEGVADSVLGRSYRLGPHLLVCGDATDPALWRELDEARGDQGYEAVWTDPPYGVDYDAERQEAARRATNRRKAMHDLIANDASDDDIEHLLRTVLGAAYERASPGGAWYVTAPTGPPLLPFAVVLSELPTLFRQGLAWVKDRLVFGRSDRHYQHEFVFYGWKEGEAHRWVGGRRRTSLLVVDGPKVSDDHPTTKPVELVAECLVCHPVRGRFVLDPFAGSGPVLVAGAQLGSVVHMIEVEPHYCDVIRRRWALYARSTGANPGPDALD